MQHRQKNRFLYFQELATTSQKYFLPYINRIKPIRKGMHILEIGCGDGGNLLPFSRIGCHTTGIDQATNRIEDAQQFFHIYKAKGTFITSDIFKVKELGMLFDVIICHDVLEHIAQKAALLRHLTHFLHHDGIVFISFPTWQMPFGGHQQICTNRFVSHMPFIHLLPTPLYKAILKAGRESNGCIKELLNIKETRINIECFERLVSKEGLSISHREFYFINPHYEIKFGLRPRKLNPIMANIPYFRNFFTTSCFYILKLG